MKKIKQFIEDWNIKHAVIIWLLWMVAMFIISRTLIERIPFGETNALQTYTQDLSIWTNWDGNNYIVIAREGYSNLGDEFFAFFPLYPLLIRIFSYIFSLSFPMAGILVSRFFLLLSIIFFIKLVEKKYSLKLAYRAVWYLLIFPTSFFFFASYTESLFLFLTLATLYFLKEHKYKLVFIFGFLAPLSRLLGVILSVIILFEYLNAIKFNFRKIKTPILTSLAPIMGLSVYGLYNYYHTRDFFGFLSAQSYWEGYGREGYNNPFMILFNNILESLGDFSNKGFLILGYFDFWFTLFGIIILIYGAKNKIIDYSYLLWSAIYLLIPVTTGSLVSIPRYMLVVFPIFIILAKLGENQYFDKIYTLMSILLLSNLIYMFIFGIWIA